MRQWQAEHSWQDTLEMLMRSRLLAKQVERVAQHAVADTAIKLKGLLGKGRELLRECQRGAKGPFTDARRPQPP